MHTQNTNTHTHTRISSKGKRKIVLFSGCGGTNIRSLYLYFHNLSLRLKFDAITFKNPRKIPIH